MRRSWVSHWSYNTAPSPPLLSQAPSGVLVASVIICRPSLDRDFVQMPLPEQRNPVKGSRARVMMVAPIVCVAIPNPYPHAVDYPVCRSPTSANNIPFPLTIFSSLTLTEASRAYLMEPHWYCLPQETSSFYRLTVPGIRLSRSKRLHAFTESVRSAK